MSKLRQCSVAFRGLFGLVLVLAWAARASAAAAPETIPPEGVVVSAVDVRGQERINKQTILNAVSAMPGRRITTQQLADDVQALTRLGFFREVRPPEVQMTPAGARITYVVEEFPTIRRVEFVGNTVLTSEQLRGILGIQPGEVFNRDLVERRLRAIEDAYRARGYVAAITEEVRLDPSGMLVIPIHEARVADVEIEGLRRTRESTVLRALSLRPGVLFNEAKLRQDFLRLQQLGVFDAIEPAVAGAPNGDVVITWQVTETARTRVLNLGLSYSPQESLVGTIGFIENNFRRRAERLRVDLNIASVPGGQLGGEVAYATPVLATGTAYNARLFSQLEYRFSQIIVFPETGGVDRYFERHNGVQFGTARDLGRGRQVALSGRYEDVRVYNLPAEFFETGTPSLNSSLLAAGLQATRDRRDSILYPTRGDYLTTSSDIGLVSRGASNSGGVMAKPRVEWRYFRALGRRPAVPVGAEAPQPRVLALRAEVGTMVGSVPFFEQYFIGGVDTLRGYSESRFWGKHSVLANAELRWPVGGGGLVAVAFVDAGHAWGSPYQLANSPGLNTRFRQSRSFSPHLGAGVGIRYLTPLGPLRLDFAIGDRFRTHFTVGQTF